MICRGTRRGTGRKRTNESEEHQFVTIEQLSHDLGKRVPQQFTGQQQQRAALHAMGKLKIEVSNQSRFPAKSPLSEQPYERSRKCEVDGSPFDQRRELVNEGQCFRIRISTGERETSGSSTTHADVSGQPVFAKNGFTHAGRVCRPRAL